MRRIFFQVESVDGDGFTVWLAEFHISELQLLNGQIVEWNQLPAEAFEFTNKLKISMTRREVIVILGQPDDVGGRPRKYYAASIFKCGEIELHFELQANGGLRCVYMEDEAGLGITFLD